MEAVSYSAFVYHCQDHSTREEEVRLISRADSVFCVSDNLVRKHRLLNPRTYLLPNGVDVQLFSPENLRAKERPKDLPAEARLMGFVGTIDCHLDFDLLLKAAYAFPNAYLILLGNVTTGEMAPRGRQRQALARLKSLKNVRVLGLKSVDTLPAYINAFEVCVIPLRQDEFNQERDPLKFYQYAAMGKPIVSSPVCVAQRHSDLCYVADSPEDFIRCISEAFKESNCAELSEKRIHMARSYSWESIVARACERLRQVRIANQ